MVTDKCKRITGTEGVIFCYILGDSTEFIYTREVKKYWKDDFCNFVFNFPRGWTYKKGLIKT